MVRLLPDPRREGEEDFKPKRFEGVVDVTYEVPKGSWKPLKVNPDSIPRKVLFVDGVRRTELRVTILNPEGENTPFAGEGIFISIGAGCALVDLDGSTRPEYRMVGSTVRRYFVHNAMLSSEKPSPPQGHFESLNGKSLNLPQEVEVDLWGRNLTFKTVESNTPDVSLYANYLMRSAEIDIAREVLSQERTFTVMDGPVKTLKFLPFISHLVKDVNNFHLGGGLENILLELKKGERTPLFVFEETTAYYNRKSGQYGTKKVKKIGAYVRLIDAREAGRFGLNPLTGLVRIEFPYDPTVSVSEVSEAVQKAAAVALHFANHPLRDRRSPQNLTPIAFVEKELRRFLGRYELIRRALLSKLSEFF